LGDGEAEGGGVGALPGSLAPTGQGLAVGSESVTGLSSSFVKLFGPVIEVVAQ